MFVVDLYIADAAIVCVYHETADISAWDVEHPHLCFSCDDHVILDEMHSDNLLTVHIQRKQVLFLLYAQTKDISFYIPKSQDVFLLIGCDWGDLILMIVEMVLVIDYAAHISEGFDRAVPGSSGDSFAFGHVD